MEQHPLFIKYRRDWLHQVMGYSRGYLCRVATGRIPLSRSFIERVCLKLGQPEDELFLPNDPPDCPDDPVATGHGSIGQWLRGRCQREHLSLREAAAKTGLSHATIGDIIRGDHPSAETVKKLAQAFGGDGKLALEDHLLELAGHRTPHQGEESSYLKVIPLLSPGHQHILEVLVGELAKIEGIK